MGIDVKMRMRYTLIIEQPIAQLQDQGGRVKNKVDFWTHLYKGS